MKFSGVLAGAVLLPACAGTMKSNEAAIDRMPVDESWTPHAASAWIPKGTRADAEDLFQKTMEASTDFSWLSRGDTVFIKLALNSANPYPATSDPWALASLIRLLREKGAGRIMVGDSSGVETVHWTENEQKGASRQCCKKSGLLAVIEENGAEAVFFEEAGYDAFAPLYPDGAHHWEEPLWITSAVDKADHIVYLARVSSHIMGDITSGMKLGVGFLREDSRKAFHQGGEAFYAMYEEINRVPAINARLRLVVSSGTKVLSTFGPDNGHVTAPGHGLVFASEDILAHELLAYSWLLYNREFETGFFDAGVTGRLTRIRSFINKGFVWYAWDDGFSKTPKMPLFIAGNIYAHPAVMNHMQQRGGRPARIDWERVNAPQGAEKMTAYINDKLTAAG